MLIVCRTRLRKKEKEQIIKEIRRLQREKVVSFNEPVNHDIEWGWKQLTSDHSSVMRSALRKISRLRLLDCLRGDAETDEPNTKEMLSHYSDFELKYVRDEISDAADGIQYLRNLINTEITNRLEKRKAAEKQARKA